MPLFSWHAGGQEFESPWLHSSNPFHRKGSQGSRKAPFLLPARRKGQVQGQVEGKSGFLTLFHRANRDPLLDPLEISQGQRPMPLKGKKGKSRASAHPHRTGGRQRTQPVFAQRVRGSFATSLPLIWSQPSIHWSCTAPPAGVMVSTEVSIAWDLHPMDS